MDGADNGIGTDRLARCADANYPITVTQKLNDRFLLVDLDAERTNATRQSRQVLLRFTVATAGIVNSDTNDDDAGSFFLVIKALLT